jgi:hypothetical protein
MMHLGNSWDLTVQGVRTLATSAGTPDGRRTTAISTGGSRLFKCLPRQKILPSTLASAHLRWGRLSPDIATTPENGAKRQDAENRHHGSEKRGSAIHRADVPFRKCHVTRLRRVIVPSSDIAIDRAPP